MSLPEPPPGREGDADRQSEQGNQQGATEQGEHRGDDGADGTREIDDVRQSLATAL
jgi:hypothetical protein